MRSRFSQLCKVNLVSRVPMRYVRSFSSVKDPKDPLEELDEISFDDFDIPEEELANFEQSLRNGFNEEDELNEAFELLGDIDKEDKDRLEEIAKTFSEKEYVDPLDIDAVAQELDEPPFHTVLEDGETWQEMASAEDEKEAFADFGVNPLELYKKIENNADKGIPSDPAEMRKLNDFEVQEEDPLSMSLGLDSGGVDRLVETSRALYEIGKLMTTTDQRQQAKSLTPLRLNPRIENELQDGKMTTGDFVMIEELDDQAKLPVERDPDVEKSKKKNCAICWCQNKAPPLDPLNVHLLLKYMNIEGRILPRRQTKLCAKWQRKVANTIRRAKHLGLLSFKNGHFSVTDPFRDNLSHDDILTEAARAAWKRVYPKEEFPGLPARKRPVTETKQ